ncbi:MAG: NAD(P)(+) transhydrogenase (Re/Si-specific) subunit alpha [Deltaproteobacteria bacterium]|nr:NAD(P)(+) transhydrogenase (Re/Si-specific) subunit alpha [Deltaproteobacteria bacterium]
MRIGIPKESCDGERRVAATPTTVGKLRDLGFEVHVESGAGSAATFLDAAYEEAGATIVSESASVWSEADLILKVREPSSEEVGKIREGASLISFLWPAQNEELVDQLRARNITSFAMDAIPRISRAQKMDALSSMANIAGYRAVIEAAGVFGSFCTGQITAAGRIAPAKVLVIGAGVAGLQALATAKSLGAIVRAFDTRPAVKEQVESLGGEFLELEFEESGDGGGGYAKVMSKEFIDAEMALFREQAPEIDIVVTTALIPGKKAPLLWDNTMVDAMKPGSVVVDLAAEQGGNCESTEPGVACQRNGVTIIGYTDLASRLATTASELYGTNMVHLLSDLKGAEYDVDLDDEIIRGAIITHEGETMWPPPPPPEAPAPAPKPAAPAPEAKPAEPKAAAAPEPEPAAAPANEPGPISGWGWLTILALIGGWAALKLTLGGQDADPALTKFIQQLTVFVLACFVGWQVVWSVTAALHTPLMSVTNAISGIILIGGMHHVSGDLGSPEIILGLLAVFFAAINVSGGFLVTQRMLKMFRK